MTAETIIQSLASGLLMGLLYGLIAVGLALIFGLMDVVNFAHGEFLMIAMYATFFLFVFFALDPLLSAPFVAAALFLFGAVVDLLIVRFAVRAKANAGMVQIFSTFGLAIVMRGLAQFFFTPDYRSIPQSWLGGKTVSIAGIFLPVPQLAGALVSILAFAALYFFINRTDFGRALEATREDAGAVALVGIDKNRVFALGWGLGAALVGLAGAIMAICFDRRHFPPGPATGRRAGVDPGFRRAVLLHQSHRFRPRAGGDAGGCRRGGAGRHRQEPGVRAGMGPRCGAGGACRRDHGDVLRSPAFSSRSRNWPARWCRSWLSPRCTSSSIAPISAARWRRRGRMPARWRWSASTRTGCSRWDGASVRRWWGLPARSWRCS